jgi:hypothetical protein
MSDLTVQMHAHLHYVLFFCLCRCHLINRFQVPYHYVFKFLERLPAVFKSPRLDVFVLARSGNLMPESPAKRQSSKSALKYTKRD